MCLIQLNTKDIRDNIQSNYYKRGVEYYAQSRIKLLKAKNEFDENDDEFVNISSIVRGSDMYTQDIDIFRDGIEITIEGACSCPVGYNCKHVAAICIKYKTDCLADSFKKLGVSVLGYNSQLSAVDKWLGNFTNTQLTSQSKRVQEHQDYFLTYRLDGKSMYDKSKLSMYKSKRLKNGSISKGTKLDEYKVMHSYSNRELKSEEDEDILQMANVFVANDYRSTMGPLNGTLGAMIVRKVIATSRCYFDYNPEPLKMLEGVLDVSFEFKLYKGEYSLKSNIDKMQYKVIVTNPQFVIDTTNNTIQEIDIDTKQYQQLSSAPKIPKEDIAKVVQGVGRALPNLVVKTPKSIKITEVKVKPMPTLHLKSDNSFVVDFSYENYSVKYTPQKEFQSFYEKGEKVEIFRDLSAELQAKETLETMGFDVFIKDDDLAVKLQEKERQTQLKVWSKFLESGLDKLTEQGWKILKDDDFELKFEPSSEVVVESEDKNDWFSLSFNLEFNGVSQPIAPLISSIINEFDDFTNMPELINIEVEENHFVEVQSRQLQPIIKTIIELLDKKEKDGSLSVSAFDAHLIDFMDDDVIWRGNKEILELSKKLKNFKGIKKVAPPKCLNAELREYQQEGLNWLNFLYEFKFGGILADDMGLGKTIQTLAHLSRLKEENKLTNPSLIVMPTSLIANWKNEAKKFTPNLKVLSLHGSDRAERFDALEEYDIVLTTYPLIVRDEKKFNEYKFMYIILDEAQKIKNPKTKMAITLKTFKSEYRLALSGTPIENHLGELWSIFSFLMPGFLDTLSFFKNFYQNPIEKEHSFERQNLLNKRVKPFMIRRTKEKVASELPAKSEIIKYTQFEAKQSKLYESIRVTMEQKVQDAVKAKGLGSSHITILDALLKLRQVCCDPSLLKIQEAQKVHESAKLELFLDLIDELIQEGRKVLVFSQFTSMLAIIEEKIKNLGISYTKLTGSTRKREEAIAQFTKGDADIFLISLKAGGVGLNLVEADTVIHYDPWWNPAVENQATDRAYRIGQTKAVFVYKLIVENTIEAKILELQKKKQALQDGIYDENKQQEDIKFSGNELLELLK